MDTAERHNFYSGTSSDQTMDSFNEKFHLYA